MTLKDDFRTRADDARREAGVCKLTNVRDQLLRSAAAWEAMAQREERVAAAREERARVKTDATTEAAAGPN